METKLRVLRLRLMERIRVLSETKQDILKDPYVNRIRNMIRLINKQCREKRDETPPGLESQVAKVKEEEEWKMLQGTHAHLKSPQLRPSLGHERIENLVAIQAASASDAYVMNSDIPRKEELKASSPALTHEGPGSPGNRCVSERGVCGTRSQHCSLKPP